MPPETLYEMCIEGPNLLGEEIVMEQLYSLASHHS